MDHPQLNESMNASTLSRACGIYELHTRLGVLDRDHVTVTHLRILLPVEEPRQRELLERIEAERLSTRALQREVNGAPETQPAQPGFERTLLAFHRRLDQTDALSGLDRVRDLSIAELRTCSEMAARMTRDFEWLHHTLNNQLERRLREF